ncbi:MAG: hypothetical protein CVV22_06600 [Ignavibacteriae bacterium HGW-Ignavibacteriae-1]|jgi:hypothetical protein|nr:MAG: hypothetical protein CVV22_06600 [Ignavibacteriae bacterium HGW-Ignavibacteriae-1]
MLFKKDYKICKNALLCSLTWWLFLAMLIVMVLMSCDVCDIGDTGGNPENRIYFTSLPGNTDEPYVYSIKYDGTAMLALVKNGLIFSAPSTNGYMAVLSRDTISGNKILYSVDSEGKNFQKVAEESSLFDINYPIMSPDGKKIAFNGGQKRLFISKYDGAYIFDLIDDNITSNTIPAFSPNSKMIAYFKKETNGDVVLKVVNTEETGSTQVIFQTIISDTLVERGEIHPEWFSDNTRIVISVSNNGAETLKIIDISSGNIREIVIESPLIGSSDPAISADGNFVALSGKDGNIWVIDILDDDYRFSRITDVFDGESAKSPTWLSNGKSIMYNLQTKYDKVSYSTLFLTNISYDGTLVNKETTYVLANSVIKGFWQSQGK